MIRSKQVFRRSQQAPARPQQCASCRTDPATVWVPHPAEFLAEPVRLCFRCAEIQLGPTRQLGMATANSSLFR